MECKRTIMNMDDQDIQDKDLLHVPVLRTPVVHPVHPAYPCGFRAYANGTL